MTRAHKSIKTGPAVIIAVPGRFAHISVDHNTLFITLLEAPYVYELS